MDKNGYGAILNRIIDAFNGPFANLANDPATTTDLTWGYQAGDVGGVTVPAGTIGLTDNSVNYVYVDTTSGVVSANTVGFPPGAHTSPLATVTTAGGVITTFTDMRSWLGGTPVTKLAELSDVAITSPVADDMLLWDDDLEQWVNAPYVDGFYNSNVDATRPPTVRDDASGIVTAAGWTPLSPTGIGISYGLCCSSNGTVIYAGKYTSGQIQKSVDGGANWSDLTVGSSFATAFTIHCSDSGAVVVVVDTSNGIYVSTDSGATWIQRQTGTQWQDAGVSGDGTKMIAYRDGTTGSEDGKGCYLSTDSGASWNLSFGYARGWACAISDDGQILFAVMHVDATSVTSLLKSSNGGTSWTVISTGVVLGPNVACSANGQYIQWGNKYSDNSGVSFINILTGTSFPRASVSDDGKNIVYTYSYTGGTLYSINLIADGLTTYPYRFDGYATAVVVSGDGTVFYSLAGATASTDFTVRKYHPAQNGIFEEGKSEWVMPKSLTNLIERIWLCIDDTPGAAVWVEYYPQEALAIGIPETIHAATTKMPPIGPDEFCFWDSITGLLRKCTFTNLAAAIQTVFNTVFAKVDLSNLGTTAVNADVLPDANDTRSLGTLLKAWLNVYANKTYTNVIAPHADGTQAILLTKADGTTVIVTFDSTNGRLGIGGQPLEKLHVIDGKIQVSGTGAGFKIGEAILQNGANVYQLNTSAHFSTTGLFAVGTTPVANRCINVLDKNDIDVSAYLAGLLTKTGDYITCIVPGYYVTARITALGGAYFKDKVGVGITSPTARVDPAAGSAGAGTAPYCLRSGVLSTVPVAGELSADSGFVYWVNAAAARLKFLFANAAITPGTKTKITYDANGLVTAGANATTVDIADSTGKRYTPDVTAPAAGNLAVLAVANGETVRSDKLLLDATAPSTQAFGDAGAAGVALQAARRDHKHAMMAAPTATDLGLGSGLSTDITIVVDTQFNTTTGNLEQKTQALTFVNGILTEQTDASAWTTVLDWATASCT